MYFKYLLSYLLITLTLSFISCQGDKFIEYDPVLVVEGHISNGTFPIVFVTTSIPISNTKKPLSELQDHILNWARVSITDGEQTVYLTGRLNNKYRLKSYFTTNTMRGEIGKTYRIKVEYDDLYAEAETTIPQPPMINSYHLEKLATSDTLYSAYTSVPKQNGTTGFYKFFVKDQDANDYEPSFMGNYTDENIGDGAELPVYRAHKNASKEKFQPNFRAGEKFHVRFASIDEFAYNYWSQYDKSISLSKNPFLPFSENLPTNIHGGIGIWYGYSSVDFLIVVPE